MPTARTRSTQPPADITKTAAGNFPLVHKLTHFADLRNFYKDMREALISANRRAGAQQGLVTRARQKIVALQAEMERVQQERDELLAYRQRVDSEDNQIAALLPRLKGRLLQVQQIEQALENLADSKEAVDQQEHHHCRPTRHSVDYLKRAVETLLERADAIEFFEESVEDLESEDAGDA